MTGSPGETKSALRAHMKAVIAKTSERERNKWSEDIAKHATALGEWDLSPILLAFLPMTGEVDTTGIISRAFKTGKVVGLPRMYGEDIEFHKIDTPDGPWDPHPYGVKEPAASLPIIDPCSDEDIYVITPGLCFDREGNRLGFGRGYYDRLITRCRVVKSRTIFFAAVCFNIQLVESIPVDEHDCVVDAIITETGLAWHR